MEGEQMGVQDTGCLNYIPSGYGLVRANDGKCLFYPNNHHIRPNFRLSEFNKDNIQPYGIMKKLVDRLQIMRTALGVPIYIMSGYRNTANTHGSGLAADISVPNKTFIQVAQAAHNAGFVRIEVQKNSGTSFTNLMSVGGHIHLDVYDGSGNSTKGTIFDCPSCDRIPCYPWYAWGIQNSWWATCQPNTFEQLIKNLLNNRGSTGYKGC